MDYEYEILKTSPTVVGSWQGHRQKSQKVSDKHNLLQSSLVCASNAHIIRTNLRKNQPQVLQILISFAISELNNQYFSKC